MDGYRKLAAVLLAELLRDARSGGRARRYARQLATEDGPLLELWCDLAKIDRSRFKAAVLAS